MRVLVIGATGNVGTSVVPALSALDEVDEIIGASRRPARLEAAKATWGRLDLVSDDIEPALEGIDAVVDLAWAIQPSRDGDTLRAVNVTARERLLAAIAAVGAPALIYNSSVGAYSPARAADAFVDEGYPTDGIPTSFYSRHKAEVERLLDRFEREHPAVRVVRFRPALIFKREAASEIRRYFAGPLLPTPLLRRGRLPLLPIPRGLRMQAVHADDVGCALAAAVVRPEARGAFNLAAEPVLGPRELGEALGARPVSVPSGLVRRLAGVTWRARLQPSPPGWLDMGMQVPLLDATRARAELDWEPTRSSTDTLRELLDGMADSAGIATPPLDPQASGMLRADEFRSGVGGRLHGRGGAPRY